MTQQQASGAATDVPDPELEKALRDKALAEARKAAAEASAAERKALTPTLPELKVTPPTETLDAGDKASPIAALNAYAEIDPASAQVVQEIVIELTGGLDGRRILVVRTLDLSKDLAAYTTLQSMQSTLMSALTAARERLDLSDVRLMMEPVSAAITMGLGALTSILSLARSNVTIRSRDVTIADSAILSALSNQLVNAGAQVVIAGFGPMPRNEVVTSITALQESRDALGDLQAEWQRTKVDGPAPALAASRERLASLRKKRDEHVTATPPQPTDSIDKAIDELLREIKQSEDEVSAAQVNVDLAKRLTESVDAFITTIHTVPEGGSMAPIAAASLYHEFFKPDSDALVLFAEGVLGGGESQYEERVGRDRAQHIGGVAITYLLANAVGQMVASGIVTRLGATSHYVGKAKFDHSSSKLPKA